MVQQIFFFFRNKVKEEVIPEYSSPAPNIYYFNKMETAFYYQHY